MKCVYFGVIMNIDGDLWCSPVVIKAASPLKAAGCDFVL